eukprot:CAMPEP_0197453860 /NCGR_PEP_ID=MMETSP1175-20131217/36211_1 /TAXON_ID=1003142 /ORGANISM="Triceratium dubium, Strain CCMP147" /LENGTH=30 /DNA_ID= /DNA_START= /DNA_END= /DNA_ORIENTATION=
MPTEIKQEGAPEAAGNGGAPPPPMNAGDPA